MRPVYGKWRWRFVQVTVPSRTRSANTGNQGLITPTRTYRSAGGINCREYQLTLTPGGRTEKAHGTACCQPGGSWRVPGRALGQFGVYKNFGDYPYYLTFAASITISLL